MYRDDEDEGFVRPEDQYRSDKKEVRQKRAAESKGNLLKLQRAVLKAKVGKENVKPDTGKKDEGDEKEEGDTKPPETFGTKTHAQQEEQKSAAVTKPIEETMIEQQQQQEEVKKQAGEEYQANAG